MSRDPTLPTMLCSYGGDLAADSGKALRNLARDYRHLEIFPDARLAGDSQRADHWKLETGAEFIASGVDGPIMGRGWRLGILDDLLKGRAAADSEGQRDTVWRWYTSDFLSRAQGSNPAQIFITARWHLDDPAARIRELHESGAEEWRILTYAALDEDDNALAEDLRPAAELVHRRGMLAAAGDSRSWHALYQSKPVPADGQFFKLDWFKASAFRWTPEHAREGLIRVYGATDFAVTEGSRATGRFISFSGSIPEDDLHILDMWRGRTTSGYSGSTGCLILWRSGGRGSVAEEKGGLASAVRPFLAQAYSRERRKSISS